MAPLRLLLAEDLLEDGRALLQALSGPQEDLPAPVPESAGAAFLARQKERIQALEARLYEKSLSVSEAIADFGSIPHDAEGQALLMVEWTEKYGREMAEKRMRIAQACWLAAKEAPVGLKYVNDVTVGIMKAKAKSPTEHRHLNATLVQISVQEPKQLEAIDIDEDDEEG